MSTLDLQKCLSFMSSLMQQTDIHPSCLAHLIQSFNFEWLNSQDTNGRKVALACISAMVSILAKKSGNSTQAQIKAGNAAYKLRGPFEVRDSVLYIGFDSPKIEINHKHAIDLLKSSCVPTPTESYVYSYGIKRHGMGQSSLLLTLTTQRLLELLSDPRLVGCLPDPTNSVIFIQLVLPGKALNPSISFQTETFDDWSARQESDWTKSEPEYQKSLYHNLSHMIDQVFGKSEVIDIRPIITRPISIGRLADDIFSESDDMNSPPISICKGDIAKNQQKSCLNMIGKRSYGSDVLREKVRINHEHRRCFAANENDNIEKLDQNLKKERSANDKTAFKKVNHEPSLTLNGLFKKRSKTVDINNTANKAASFQNIKETDTRDSECTLGRIINSKFRIREVKRHSKQSSPLSKISRSMEFNKTSAKIKKGIQSLTFTELKQLAESPPPSTTKVLKLDLFKLSSLQSSDTITIKSRGNLAVDINDGSRAVGFFRVRRKKN